MLEAIVVIFFNQVSNRQNFPHAPQSERKTSNPKPHRNFGMLIYYMMLDPSFLTNHRLLRVTLRILFVRHHQFNVEQLV